MLNHQNSVFYGKRQGGHFFQGLRLTLAALLFFSHVPIQSQGLSSSPALLKNVEYKDHVFQVELNRQVPYDIFTLQNPPRLVMQLEETIYMKKVPASLSVEDDILTRIRSAQFQSDPEKVTRVVLDMKTLLPFEAEQKGEKIFIRFSSDAKNTASVSTSTEEKSPNRLSGQMQGEITAAAEAEEPEASSEEGPKDLLAALPTNPVTIDFEEADLRDVIRVLSEMSGINMIHETTLTGLVSIRLEEVPFNEAFSTILTMQGLVPQQIGNNILRILTPEGLNADRARSVVTYKTFPLSYAQAADIVPHLAAVRISPNARATVHAPNNEIIITDTVEGLAAAERLIAELDKKPLQVMIEAKIVEVVLTDNLDLGVSWEYSNVQQDPSSTRILGQRSLDSGDTPGFTGTQNNPVSGSLEEVTTRSFSASERGTGVSLPGPQQAGITFGFINNTDLLTLTLNALAEKGNAKTLSSPKVVTINNQEARIQVGSSIPIQASTISDGIVTNTIEYQEIGIILVVTPNAIIDKKNGDRVRLEIQPEVSSPGTSGAAGIEIRTRNFNGTVMIRDGETLVVGGLLDEQTRENASKVPILGDIPILGTFFRSSSDQKTRSELLVFVTPRILRD